jgi:hypothetical protein
VPLSIDVSSVVLGSWAKAAARSLSHSTSDATDIGTDLTLPSSSGSSLAPQSSCSDLPRHEVKNLLIMAALGGLPKYPGANVLTSVRREASTLQVIPGMEPVESYPFVTP